MLHTLLRKTLRFWSRSLDASRGSPVDGAVKPVLESLEMRAMLSADVVEVIGDDSRIMETTAVGAPGGVAVVKPEVNIVATDAVGSETGPDNGVFTISRTGSTNKSMTVQLVIGGKAKNGIDYTPIPANIVIPVGKSSIKVKIRPVDDARVETTESVKLEIITSKSYAIGEDGAANLKILNNDGPKVSVSASDASAGETGSDRGIFVLSRAGGAGNAEALEVRYTVAGTGRNGVDYTRLGGTVVIPAGKSSVKIAVKPVNDLHAESTESVQVKLKVGLYLVGTSGKATVTLADNDAANGEGFITFSAPDGDGGAGHVFFMPAQIGALPINVTTALNQINGRAGSDAGINISPDGQWLALRTNRFDSNGDDFDLVVYPVEDLGAGRLVTFEGVPEQPLGKVAIFNGDLLVFESGDGPNETDLWAATRSGSNWTKVLLTGDSTHDIHTAPAISDDGTKVLFAAGEAFGTAIMEVGIDGGGLDTVITNADGPDGAAEDAPLSSPDYAPGGSVVFHAGWTGNQIWKLDADGETPVRVANSTNESAPTVLSDGRYVTLWGDRPGNDEHVLELTLRYPDGGLLATLLPGVDLPEDGIGAGG